MRETGKRKPSSLLIKVLNVLTVLVLLAAIFSITKLVYPTATWSTTCRMKTTET